MYIQSHSSKIKCTKIIPQKLHVHVQEEFMERLYSFMLKSWIKMPRNNSCEEKSAFIQHTGRHAMEGFKTSSKKFIKITTQKLHVYRYVQEEFIKHL